MYIAHINDNGKCQTCTEHCIETAKFAKNKLININLGNVAYMAGILHDAGKFSDDFKKYIIDAYNGLPVKKGSVIHTFSGCSFVLKNYHENNLDFKDVTSEIIAYAIAAHHGLFDCVDEDGNNGFEHRLNKQPEYDEKSMNSFFDECVGKEELDKIFNTAVYEIKDKISIIFDEEYKNVEVENNTKCFYIGLLTRLILSAIIDGDRTDTYNFMAGIEYSNVELIDGFKWETCIGNLEKYIDSKNGESPIKKARRELSFLCNTFSDNITDIYQMKLPTGAGKTLSGLRFAINHAKKNNKKRIFYIAPLISILEQNSRIIKEAVGNSEIVLEHHSNVIIDDDNCTEIINEGYNNSHLLTDNWNAPIVVTTLVQFLNTLFGEKTSQIRRFSSLVDSVVIIDEVQTVPWKMLSLFNIAMNFLKKACNTTILLCSATQPSFDKMDYKIFVSDKKFLSNEQDAHYAKIFKRSEIVFDGNYRLSEIPDYIISLLQKTNNLLVVCNKKTQAEFLYKALNQNNLVIFHLSASMCMEHRENVLKDLNLALFNNNNKVVCVSTQVIEAGVDISFETVVRFESGLDSIIQSNGRCNRNGELDYISKTHIVRCMDEDLTKLEDIRCAKNAMTELIEIYNNEKELFDNDLSTDKSIEKYYEGLYSSFSEKKTYYYSSKYDDYLLYMLSDNKWKSKSESKNGNRYFLNQSFKSAGSCFEPLDCENISVLVPYKKGKLLINSLCSEKTKFNIRYTKKLIDESKRYSVSIMKYQAEKMMQQGALYRIFNDSILVLRNEFYSNEIGVINRKEESDECNILIL